MSIPPGTLLYPGEDGDVSGGGDEGGEEDEGEGED